MQVPGSVKHMQIDKARSNASIVVAIATIVTVFCLVSTKSLFSQAAYQKRVVNAKQATDKTLQANVVAANTLVNQYNQVFEGTNPTNIIGGKNDKSTNAVPPNGDNARIVLDALPSKYDYPALVTSVSNILNNDGVVSQGISGTDDSTSISNSPTQAPSPQPIQLVLSGNTSYPGVETVINDLERSIRPFDITNFQISGKSDDLSFTLTATTYYQSAKSLGTTTKEVH
jgi:hypothetical protein